jgi:hypothetical protein
MSQRPILIIGGSGKTGGRVNTLLQARGIATRSVSRSTAIPFDWTRPEPGRTLSTALPVPMSLTSPSGGRGLSRGNR